jgi:hypothetical protein
MRVLFALLLTLFAATPPPQLSHEDSVRIAEFYRLSPRIEDKIWPDWSRVPSPLLLVTDDNEFLTHSPNPPKDFARVADDLYYRPRHFDPHLLATFPAFGPPAVIVIGTPKNTDAKTSTPWLLTVMHEHFHQLQNAQPGYQDAVAQLNLSGGDTTGMWMLNYPFPYDKLEVVKDFAALRDLLLQALNAADGAELKKASTAYLAERERVFSKLKPDDRKYFSFQLWQEGIARYTQLKAAEMAATYEPTADYRQLSDYESFADYAPRMRRDTFEELKHADLATMKRTYVYSFGAAEGLLLDRIHPQWKQRYFDHLLSMDALFEGLR